MNCSTRNMEWTTVMKKKCEGNIFTRIYTHGLLGCIWKNCLFGRKLGNWHLTICILYCFNFFFYQNMCSFYSNRNKRALKMLTFFLDMKFQRVRSTSVSSSQKEAPQCHQANPQSCAGFSPFIWLSTTPTPCTFHNGPETDCFLPLCCSLSGPTIISYSDLSATLPTGLLSFLKPKSAQVTCPLKTPK